MRRYVTCSRMAKIEKRNTECWPGCGTSEIRIQCWWDYQMVEFTWIISCLIKLNIYFITWPSDSIPRYLPRRYKSTKRLMQEYEYTSYIHNWPKLEATQMTVKWWINKLWYMCTVEYYWTIKSELRMHAIVWANHQNIILNETTRQKI